MGFIYKNALRAKAEALAGQDSMTAGRRHESPEVPRKPKRAQAE